jgi:hypothetical protein
LATVAYSTQPPLLLGPSFEVSTSEPDAELRAWPRLAMAADDSFIVVWASEVSPGTDHSSESVLAQRFAADGTPLGGEFQVNTSTSGPQYLPSAAFAPDGRFLVVWTDRHNNDNEIKGQLFAADGTPLGDELQLNTFTTGNQSHAAVAAAPDNTFLVIWPGGSDGGIAGRRLGVDGLPAGGELSLQGPGSIPGGLPDLGFDAAGGFVVTYQSYGSNGTDDDLASIHAQRFGSDGSPLSDEMQINTDIAGNQTDPRIGVYPDSGFVVVWETDYVGPFHQHRARGQRVDATGGLVGDEMILDPRVVQQENPAVTVSADGDFTVAWRVFVPPWVWVQRYDRDGVPRSDAVFLDAPFDDADPDVAAGSGGRFVVSWRTYEYLYPNVTGKGIWAQRLLQPIFADGFESGDTAVWSTTVP